MVGSRTHRTSHPQIGVLLESVAERAREAAVFGEITVEPDRLKCTALASAQPAQYRIEEAAGELWVALVTADRWLSQSIEADLVHTGDKLDELLEEELLDQSYDRGALAFQHYRSEDKLFTFRSPLPFGPAEAGRPESIDAAAKCLLAYEACFRRLGDMNTDDEE